MSSLTYLAHMLGTMVAAFPPSTRTTMSALQQGVGILNVTGDVVMVGVAVVLWLRQRSRAGVPSSQPAVSTGEL